MKKACLCISVISSFNLLLGCGGSGGGGSSSSVNSVPAPVEPQVFVGQFVDANVAGLNYQTPTQSGQTNSQGEFNYQLDEMVSFSIGGIALPDVSGQSIITPLDVFASDTLDNQKVINLTRFLQSLDSDGYAENGIEINAEVHQTLANATLDFSNRSFDTQANELLNQINGYYINLVSEEQAIMHLQMTLEQLGQVTANTCGNSHPLVGYSAYFEGYFHEVAGKVTVINDCTIEISEFYYDGLGPDVYIYAGTNHEYDKDSAFAISRKINGPPFENAILTLRLPTGKTLDDFNSLSVWCVAASADFGSVSLDP